MKKNRNHSIISLRRNRRRVQITNDPYKIPMHINVSPRPLLDASFSKWKLTDPDLSVIMNDNWVRKDMPPLRYTAIIIEEHYRVG